MIAITMEDLFDTNWYQEQLAKAKIRVEGRYKSDLLAHYKDIGKFNTKLSPSPFFDSEFYLAQYQDVANDVEKNNTAVIDHFIKVGQFQNLNPSPFFDSNYYAQNNQDVVNAQFIPLKHYIEYGQYESIDIAEYRNPSIYFSTFKYLSKLNATEQQLIKKEMSKLDAEKNHIKTNYLFKHFYRKRIQDETSFWLSIYRLAKLVADKSLDTRLLKGIIQRYQTDIINEAAAEKIWLDVGLTTKVRVAFQLLVNNKVDSATAIACLTSDQFKKIMQKAEADDKSIMFMYTRAKEQATKVAAEYIKHRQNYSPYLRNLSFSRSAASVNKEGDSYQDLFGKLDYFSDNENSIYSPAAYYCELMQNIDDGKNFNVTVDSHKLRVRRPDLFEIPLDIPHTTTLIPHVKLENFILSRFYIRISQSPNASFEGKNFEEIQEIYEKNAFRIQLNDIDNNFSPPYNMPLDIVRTNLDRLKTSLFESYLIFGNASSKGFLARKESSLFNEFPISNEDNSINLALEYLSIDPVEYQWFQKILFGNIDLFDGKDSIDVSIFCKSISMDRKKLKALIPYRSALTAENINEYKASYINRVTKNLDIVYISLDIDNITERINNLSPERVNRIRFFLLISERLNCSVKDTQCVFDALNIGEPGSKFTTEHLKILAEIKWIKAHSSLSCMQVCGLISDFTEQSFAQTFSSHNDQISATATSFRDSYIQIKKLQEINADKIDAESIKAINLITLLCNTLSISSVELVAALNGVVKEKANISNITLVSWLYRLVQFKKLCGISILDLQKIQKYFDDKGSDKADKNSMTYLYQSILVEQDTFKRLYIISRTYHFIQWSKENSLSFEDISFLIGEEVIEIETRVRELSAKFSQALNNILKVTKTELKDTISNLVAIEFNISPSLALDVLPYLKLTGDSIEDDSHQLYKIFKLKELFDLAQFTAGGEEPRALQNSYHAEMSLLLNIIYGKDSNFLISIEKLELLTIYKKLRNVFKSNSCDFLCAWNMNKKAEFLAKTNWEESIFDIIDNICKLEFGVVKELYDAKSIDKIYRAYQLMLLLNKLGDQIQAFNQLQKLSLSDLINTSFTSSLFDEHLSLVNMLFTALKTLNSKDFDETDRIIQEKKRNMLVQRSLLMIIKKAPELNIHTIQQLSEHLLIDFEMNSKYSTSYIVEGIATLQRFMQRTRLGLEKGVACLMPEKEFNLIEHYRVWEANRKVFLYPENYLEPELRKDQTAEFKQFNDMLLQSNLDTNQLEEIFKTYVHQLSILGNLVYVDVIRKNESNDYFLFARTQSDPAVYYYRNVNINDRSSPVWSNWIKIDLRINVKDVKAVYAFNRLFIFWSDLKKFKNKEKKADANASNKSENYIDVDALDYQINFSYQNNQGAWQSPQVLENGKGVVSHYDGKIKLDLNITNQRILFQPFAKSRSDSSFSAVIGLDGNVYLFDQIRDIPEPNQGSLVAYIRRNRNLWEANQLKGAFDESLNYYLRASRRVAVADNKIAIFSLGKIKDKKGSAALYEYPTKRYLDFNNDSRLLTEGWSEDINKQTTIRFLGIGKLLYLLALDGSGQVEILSYNYGIENPKVSRISNEPKFSGSADYWKNAVHSRTFTAVEVLGKLYLIAKSPSGIETYLFNDTSSNFSHIPSNNIFSEEYWNKLEYAATIRATVVYNMLYLVAKDESGFVIYMLDTAGDNKWNKMLDVPSFDKASAELQNTAGYYDAIKVFTHQNLLCVMARTPSGMQLRMKNTSDNQSSWIAVPQYFFDQYPDKVVEENDLQYLIDQANYYSRVTPLSVGKTFYLITNDTQGICTYECKSDKLLEPYKTRSYLKFDQIKVEAEYLGSTLCINENLHVIPLQQNFKSSSNENLFLTNQSEFQVNLQKQPMGWNSDIVLSRRELIRQFDNQLIIGTYDDLCKSMPALGEFYSPYANYFWELFFHAPLLVANTLNAKQQFEEARKWYQYIFNPNTSKFKFLFPPFSMVVNSLDNFADIIAAISPEASTQIRKAAELSEQNINALVLSNFNKDPFNPHVIATLRPIAYMKMVVMKYIKNLIDWSDALFSEDTRESIIMAINIYMMAKDLLGSKPQALGQVNVSRTRTITFNNFIVGTNAIALGEVTEIILKRLENETILQDVTVSSAPNLLNLFFSIPENNEFIAYWDKIDDRLFKIRHSLNIGGIRRELDLFSPEIDPHQLVRAAASGSGLIDIKEFLSRPAPLYRFEYMLASAKEFTNHLIQLGNTLLSLLERYDGEKLTNLLQQHQSRMLDLVDRIKQQQIDEANYVNEQTANSLDAAKRRKNYYNNLIAQGLSLAEAEAKSKKCKAFNKSKEASVSQTAASGVALIPEVSTGTAGLGPYLSTTMISGAVLAKAFEIHSAIMRMEADDLNFSADTQLQEASYKRREQEWLQQQDEAQHQCDQLERQFAISKIHVDIAKQEYANYQESIRHQQAVMQFYQSKFTNLELYRWMMNALMLTYKQFYDIALNISKSAERSYQYELKLSTDTNFIGNNHYSFFRRGLLAGELLSVELANMQKSYLTENKRWYELEKTISFKDMQNDNNKSLLAILKEDPEGKVPFKVTAAVFNENLGLNERRIKRILISVPSLAKPYQNTYFSLELNSSKSDWHNNQKIVFSAGMNESGIFQPNLQDPRYLPFEGVEISDDKDALEFTLKIGDKNLLNSVGNILITIQYVARTKQNSNDNSNNNSASRVLIDTVHTAPASLVLVKDTSEESNPKIRLMQKS